MRVEREREREGDKEREGEGEKKKKKKRRGENEPGSRLRTSVKLVWLRPRGGARVQRVVNVEPKPSLGSTTRPSIDSPC